MLKMNMTTKCKIEQSPKQASEQHKQIKRNMQKMCERHRETKKEPAEKEKKKT